MAVEAGHIQLYEYRKTTIPYLNYMFEDLFCRYGVSIPYYLLDFSFPDYQIIAEWPAPYTPEWLELYRPKLPPWPEIPWWDIPDWKLPDMPWPGLPWVDWPRLPDMPWPDIPDWPEWDIPEWERPEFYWPEWDWPEWGEPEPLDKRKRRRRKKLIELITEVYKTKKISVGITLPKPPIEIILPKEIKEIEKEEIQKETEEKQILEYPGKPQWPLIQKPDWFEKTASDWPPDSNGFNFNIDQGEFGYDLPKLNELLGLLFDEADLPRLALPDLSPQSIAILNDEITTMYEAVEPTSADYTYNSQEKGGYLEKFGIEEDSDWGAGDASWNDTWDEMKAATPDVYMNPTAAGIPVNTVLLYGNYTVSEYQGQYKHKWRATVGRAYMSFDTSNLIGKTITVVTLKIYIERIFPTGGMEDYETTRTINVYTKNWGTLGAGDWNGGTLVATFEETDLTADEYYTITLTDTSTISKTGETQFEIACKADIDNDTITDPQDLGDGGHRGGVAFNWISGNHTENKPILTVTATG